MKNQEDLTKRLLEFRNNLEEMTNHFTKSVARLKKSENNHYNTEQFKVMLYRAAGYVNIKNSFYKIFPELKPEEKQKYHKD